MNIETYKGFEITLDTSTGKFTGDGATSRMGKEFESTSLKTLKKKINDFIKENQSFGAFKVRPKSEGNTWDLKKLKDLTTVKGVTSNKRLTIEKPDGRSATIGKHDINRYVIYNEEHNSFIDKALKIKAESDDAVKIANDKIKALLGRLEEKPLTEFLKEAGIEVDMDERGW